MFTIRFSPTVQIQQIENFPKNCSRSCKGSIHIKPGSTKMVTSDEMEYMKNMKIPFQILHDHAVKQKKVEEDLVNFVSESNEDLIVDDFDNSMTHSIYGHDQPSEGPSEGKKRKKKK